MLNILSSIVGPHRAVSIYAFVKTKGLALFGVAGVFVVAAGLLLFNGDGTHVHDAYLTVAVLSETPIKGNLKNGVIASVRLPDGSATMVTTTDGPVAQTVGTTACVEKRVYVDSGEPRYRFKLPKYCAGN